MLKSKNLFLLS
jgi:hypothetical protein